MKKLSKEDQEWINATLTAANNYTLSEAEHGLKLARIYGLENEFLVKVSEVTEIWTRELRSVSCYVWSQACFEIGLNYEKGSALTLADVESRLKASKSTLRSKHCLGNKKYWKLEKALCTKLLKEWKGEVKKPTAYKTAIANARKLLTLKQVTTVSSNPSKTTTSWAIFYNVAKDVCEQYGATVYSSQKKAKKALYLHRTFLAQNLALLKLQS